MKCCDNGLIYNRETAGWDTCYCREGNKQKQSKGNRKHCGLCYEPIGFGTPTPISQHICSESKK